MNRTQYLNKIYKRWVSKRERCKSSERERLCISKQVDAFQGFASESLARLSVKRSAYERKLHEAYDKDTHQAPRFSTVSCSVHHRFLRQAYENFPKASMIPDENSNFPNKHRIRQVMHLIAQNKHNLLWQKRLPLKTRMVAST